MLDDKYQKAKKINPGEIATKAAGEYFKKSAKGIDTPGRTVKRIFKRKVVKSEGGDKK